MKRAPGRILGVGTAPPLPRCFVSVLLALAGCIPAPSVVGRPAAVLPHGRKTESQGGGAFYLRWEDFDTQESEEMGFGYYHYDTTSGVGRRCDVQVGFNNWFQVFGVARVQILGYPEGERTRPGLDFSFEAGASVLPTDAIMGDVHLGANTSLAGRRLTPYVSYRYHWANLKYQDTRTLEQHMLFLGVELRRPERRPLVVEVFHGWNRKMDPGNPSVPTTWGLNVILRTRE